MRFEQLADEHQRDDHADRFEIWLARIVGKNVRHEGNHAGIGECGKRTKADKRVHFRSAMNDRRETAAENRQRRIADNRQHQQELRPVRHWVQHEHSGTEHWNRADCGHNEADN